MGAVSSPVITHLEDVDDKLFAHLRTFRVSHSEHTQSSFSVLELNRLNGHTRMYARPQLNIHTSNHTRTLKQTYSRSARTGTLINRDLSSTMNRTCREGRVGMLCLGLMCLPAGDEIWA